MTSGQIARMTDGQINRILDEHPDVRGADERMGRDFGVRIVGDDAAGPRAFDPADRANFCDVGGDRDDRVEHDSNGVA